MQKEYPIDYYFTQFKKDISHLQLPDKFTYPFYYEPHPLTIIAAEQLQEHLLTQQDWHHDFGIDHLVKGSNIGKMFGVLVVQKKNGELGFLSAFSGKLAESNHLPGFVPPIFDLLNKNGFFKIEEDQISRINQKIEALENNHAYLKCQEKNQADIHHSEQALKEFRQQMKRAKDARKKRRGTEKQTLNESDFQQLIETLKQESLQQQYDYKQLKKEWHQRIINNQNQLKTYTDKIEALKEERKKRSAALQQKLFNQYQFLNKNGDSMGVSEIFAKTSQKVPPAGAGDCAAPKLFQFAFAHQLKPIAMAEFWWGQSPKSEIRKHKHFYPSCRGKCEPILGHMLKGIPMDDNPIQTATMHHKELEIVYEDETILIINKPAEFLSVPGKKTQDSVLLRVQQKYPNATGPLLAHRLDMSTSGLILVAKTKEAHKVLQKQFEDRTIHKRYVALLDGIVKSDEGFIELPLRVDLDDRPRQLVCYEYGKPAKTKYKVIERKDGRTKIHFFPITGRTHQLRVHAAHPMGLNLPIVGDDLYGTKNERLYLHAEYLEFNHPISHKKMKIKAKADF